MIIIFAIVVVKYEKWLDKQLHLDQNIFEECPSIPAYS